MRHLLNKTCRNYLHLFRWLCIRFFAYRNSMRGFNVSPKYCLNSYNDMLLHCDSLSYVARFFVWSPIKEIICAGQPKRHLLTTGWSVFVSAKRLVAGDAVIFIWYCHILIMVYVALLCICTPFLVAGCDSCNICSQL